MRQGVKDLQKDLEIIRRAITPAEESEYARKGREMNQLLKAYAEAFEAATAGMTPAEKVQFEHQLAKDTVAQLHAEGKL